MNIISSFFTHSTENSDAATASYIEQRQSSFALATGWLQTLTGVRS